MYHILHNTSCNLNNIVICIILYASCLSSFRRSCITDASSVHQLKTNVNIYILIGSFHIVSTIYIYFLDICKQLKLWYFITDVTRKHYLQPGLQFLLHIYLIYLNISLKYLIVHNYNFHIYYLKELKSIENYLFQTMESIYIDIITSSCQHIQPTSCCWSEWLIHTDAHSRLHNRRETFFHHHNKTCSHKTVYLPTYLKQWPRSYEWIYICIHRYFVCIP